MTTSPLEVRSQAAVARVGNDDLWKVLGRLDGIVAAVNSKSSFLIAYDTFITGTILLKWEVLVAGLSPNVRILTSTALSAILVTSFLSLVFTFCAATPFLRSPRRPNRYHSILFFGHIHEHAAPEEYWSRLSADNLDLGQDLAFQIHAMSAAVATKTLMIRRSIFLILLIQLPLVAVVSLIKAITLFVSTT